MKKLLIILLVALICSGCANKSINTSHQPKNAAEIEHAKQNMTRSFTQKGWQKLDNDFSGKYFSVSFPDGYLVFKKTDKTDQDVIMADHIAQNDDKAQNAHVILIFAHPVERGALDYWETAPDEKIAKDFYELGKTVSVANISGARFVRTEENANVRYFTIKNGIDISIYAPNAMKENHRQDFEKTIMSLKIK